MILLLVSLVLAGQVKAHGQPSLVTAIGPSLAVSHSWGQPPHAFCRPPQVDPASCPRTQGCIVTYYLLPLLFLRLVPYLHRRQSCVPLSLVSLSLHRFHCLQLWVTAFLGQLQQDAGGECRSIYSCSTGRLVRSLSTWAYHV